MAQSLGPFSLERMVRAVEKVRERLLRATAALENASIPYAVCGGNAVAVWVTRIDESAVRNTRDVDILIRRTDVYAVKAALSAAGFGYKHTDVGLIDESWCGRYPDQLAARLRALINTPDG